jgi:hypothetical protein
MAKDMKTAAELEALVMAEIKSVKACKGTTGVVVNRTATSWTVDQFFHCTPQCQEQIGEIVRRLRGSYDLTED